jgi:superfamily II DNA or RNA helicase
MQGVPIRAGDAVRIRGERWRIVAEAFFHEVSIVDVDGCDATNLGTKARFLLPFERIDTLAARSSVPRTVTHARWRRAARAMLAGAVPQWASLRAAAKAQLTILPFQLEPAIAVTRGDACRVLIADEVGLGKTIQAALIVAETIARTPDARALIVSPAGLRDQWRTELQSRFGLDAEVLDAGGVARNAAQLVPEANPWSIHPLVITSIDYVKRPEVLRALETLTWDVVVFDEAHALAGRSDRATAASALARRARTLIMLTATPHPGDDGAYTRLCELGDLGAAFPLAIFRRTRFDVGLPHGRRTTRLRIRPTGAELAMHRALDDYARRLAAENDAPGAALLASILTRRACSSACSLARSLERRMTLLQSAPATSRDQLLLPLADPDTDEEPGGELGVAGLRDPVDETRRLQKLCALALRASTRESKVRALARVIRRTREPVLLFTEYRDTLQHLAAELDEFAPLQLHGGLTSRERAAVIRQFTAGDAPVLLATDAASEGLNLHHRCRLVVNLELPWTPLRLEQRIGRVDRLGQPRRVHALQLVARNTPEESMGVRLDERAARIHASLDNPPGFEAALRRDAQAEAARLVSARSLCATARQFTSGDRPLVTIVTGHDGHRGAIWAYRLSCVDEGGRVVFETIAGVRDDRSGFAIDAGIEQMAARHHEAVVESASAAITTWLDLSAKREDAIVAGLRENHARLSAALLQPGLFDRRAARAASAQASRVEEAVQKSRDRQALLARARRLHAAERDVMFGVAFRS